MSNVPSRLSQKSPEEIELLLGELPRLWLEGGQLNKLSRLLSNYEFIEAKLNHPEFGVKALIEDYELIDDIEVSHPEYSKQTIKSLKLIQGALRLSTHILTQDPSQLAGQLSGRLLDFNTPDIKRLLQQIPQTETTYLRSLRATLNPPTGPLLSTLIGHGDSVNAVAVTPDDTRVISGSSDKTVKVWNLNTGAEIFTLKGHSARVHAVAVTPDGTRVISGASDNTVRVWSLATGKEIQRFNGHSHPVVAVAVTPNGKEVVSVSVAKYNSIKVWDLETGEELSIKANRDFVRTVAITCDNRLIYGLERGTIKVWDLTNGKIITLRHRPETLYPYFLITYFLMRLYVIAVTLDGKWLISGFGHKGRNMITIWNLETGEKTVPIKGHKNPISALAITPDGKQVIYAAFDNTIKIWDRESGKEMLSFIAHDDLIYDIKITGDGNKIISASQDKTVKVWNLESKGKYLKFKDNKNSVNDVTITTDCKKAIFALQNKLINVFDLEQKTISFSFYSNKYYSDNDKILKLAHYHNLLRNNVLIKLDLLELFMKLLITLPSFVIPFIISHILLIIFIALGSLLLVPILIILIVFIVVVIILELLARHFENIANFGINCKKMLNKFNLFDILEKKSSEYSKYSDLIEMSEYNDIYLKVLNDKNYLERNHNLSELAIAPKNFMVFINQPIMGFQFLTVWNYRKINKICDLISIQQYCYIYWYLFISCIGLLISLGITIFVYFLANYLSLWEIILAIVFFPIFSGNIYLYINFMFLSIFEIFEDSATTLSITPDGNHVISGSTNTTIKVWHLETKKLCFVLRGHNLDITSLAITPDGKYLVSGSKDKTIKLWNLETRKECLTLKGHGDSINTLSVTPDGKYVVSGSKDNTIKIWDLEKREEIFTFTGHTDSINRIKVTSNGKLVISASSDKTLQVWDFETREVIAKFTGESAINCCAVAPDDVTIVAGDEGGNMHFLRLEGVGSREWGVGSGEWLTRV
ncbi:MAG: WD40 repeat domain-containing protein [Moorea sp. SIOASIH]|uniref:WD40 repeat domain-containing protein n=1 Tax=Moorena sp. SIOASIH TaxID=2607817 RepID=UPI0013BE2282|nr:WD40 repeat domain-containing protein [Moorena sp. SIOASIH]NEO40180.1 WD40 repeat domain-containing protein [Moorena sp. SIOASIH]